ncbi:uncharacterized protein DS421_4g120900 [Arachis hypogaea]|nr:uncharacterized protein DS421_4g120900 [Arachis hypogaea]
MVMNPRKRGSRKGMMKLLLWWIWLAPLKFSSTGYKFPGGPVMYMNDDGGGGQYDEEGDFFGDGGGGGGGIAGGGGDGYTVPPVPHGVHFSSPISFLDSSALVA